MKRALLIVWVLVLLLIQVLPACAIEEHGLLLDRGAVDPQVMSKLDAEIAQARLEIPSAFEDLSTIVADLPNRPPSLRIDGRDPIVNYLTPIGQEGLFPMLEMLVIRAPAAATLNETLKNELRLSLIRAVGLIRDSRAVPIMDAILLADQMDIWARKEAAYSFTHLPTNDATALLFLILDNDEAPLDARRAVYAVIGRCHGLDVANRLAKDLFAEPDPGTATSIVTALGELGNRGAWKAFRYAGDERSEEKDETTRVVTEAIIWAFVNYDDTDVREAAGRGLRLTQHDSTQAQIQAQRAVADEELSAALEQLEKGYVRSVEQSRAHSRDDGR